MAGDKSLPARRDQQRRQNSQNRRFSRAICAQQCDCFAFLHFEGDALECWPRRALKWLDKRAYSGARWRIIFLQILQDNSGERRGILHRIFIAFPSLQYKPYPGVRIWRRNSSQSGLGNATITQCVWWSRKRRAMRLEGFRTGLKGTNLPHDFIC
jgi:hypothetical protein